MINYKDITMRLPAEMAQKLLADGKAEVVQRQASGKLQLFAKGIVVSEQKQPQEQFSKLADAIIEQVNINKDSIDSVTKSLNHAGSHLFSLESSVKNLSGVASAIYKDVSLVRNVSFLNVGIATANLALDVAGFIVVANKVNELRSYIDVMSDDVKKIMILNKNEIVSEYKTLGMKFNAVSTRIKNGEFIDSAELEQLLVEFNTYIEKIYNDLNDEALETGFAMQLIFTLIPSYTKLMQVYLTSYYPLYHNIPDNYENFISLYDKLLDEGFITRIQDYFVLNEKFSFRDALAVINCQKLITIDNKVQVIDQLELLQSLGTIDNWNKFSECINNYVRDTIKEEAHRFTEDNGLDSDDFSNKTNELLAEVGMI